MSLSLLSSLCMSCVVLIIVCYGSVGLGLRLNMMWLGCLMFDVCVFYVCSLIVFICVVLSSVLMLLIDSSGLWFGLSFLCCVMNGILWCFVCFWKNSLLVMLLGVCMSDMGWFFRLGNSYGVIYC